MGFSSPSSDNLHLQIVVWSWSYHSCFPRGCTCSQTNWMGFLPVKCSVTCRVSKALDAFWCLTEGYSSTSLNSFIPYSVLFGFSSKTMSSSTSYHFSAFQKFLEFPSLFFLLYLVLPSFFPSPLPKFLFLLNIFHHNKAITYNSSFYAKPWVFCGGLGGGGEIWTNKRFYFAWKLGRLSHASFQTLLILGLLCTEGDLKKYTSCLKY